MPLIIILFTEEDLNNYLTTYNKTIGNFPEKNLRKNFLIKNLSQ